MRSTTAPVGSPSHPTYPRKVWYAVQLSAQSVAPEASHMKNKTGPARTSADKPTARRRLHDARVVS